MNLYELFKTAAATYPDNLAVVFEGRAKTYRELDQDVVTVSAKLNALGIAPGDRVLMFSPNLPEYLSVFMACAYLGAVFAPVNAAFRERELRYIVNNAQADVAIVHAEHLANFNACVAGSAYAPQRIVLVGDISIDTNDRVIGTLGNLPFHTPAATAYPSTDATPLLILYTSGSTSVPKGVLHSHASVAYCLTTYSTIWNYQPSDRGVVVPPMPWAFGLLVTSMAMLVKGATILLLQRFHPERTLETIENARATLFFGTMSMYSKMLEVMRQKTFDLSSLHLCVNAGEPCPDGAVRVVEERFGRRLIQAWALSENHPTVSMHWDDFDAPRGTAGRATPGTRIRLLDQQGNEVVCGEVGEAYVSGPGKMLRYFGEPELTAGKVTADNFVRTNDLLRRDEQGFYFVVGRASEMIIRSGANIAPAEVETALLECSGVGSACVVGVPDPRSGESVVAFVVPNAGRTVTGEALLGELKSKLAQYKIPQRIEMLDDLPSTASGKLDRVMLKKLAASEPPGR